MFTAATHPLPKKDFENLMEKRNHASVSIYIPMDKKGKEQNKHLAQSLLKQCINEVQKVLTDHQMSENETEEYLKPVLELLDKIDLWRNPSEGLAIFLNSEDGMRYYQVPIPFDVYTYVASSFYLIPLLPLYHCDGLYYLLELSEDYIKLYKASRYLFEDMYFEKYGPSQLEDAVGFDFKSKMLQIRSGQNVYNKGTFHGHGEGKDGEKKELIKFYRAVGKGLKKVIKNQKTPLIIASVDSVFHLFCKVSTYPTVFNKNITGDPQFKNKLALHQESWDIIASYFEIPKSEKLCQFKELYHSQKTSYEIDAIISASLNGIIDTLFIATNSDIFGLYTPKTRKVTVDKKRENYNVSLTNLAALETFKKGGNVYFLNYDEMPIKEHSMNAIFRY